MRPIEPSGGQLHAIKTRAVSFLARQIESSPPVSVFNGRARWNRVRSRDEEGFVIEERGGKGSRC